MTAPSVGGVLALAFDTATAATSVALGRVDGPGAVTLLAERNEPTANRHVERLTPLITEVLAAASVATTELGLIVAGVGPGPFTGLRVGLVTATALAQSLGIEAVGAGSLDAVAFAAPRPWEDGFAVLADARRREVYWACYRGGRRVAGPGVARPEALPPLPGTLLGAGAIQYRDRLPDPAAVDETAPYPPAAALLRLGTDPQWRLPLRPVYLRRPDAVPPGPPKAVLPR